MRNRDVCLGRCLDDTNVQLRQDWATSAVKQELHMERGVAAPPPRRGAGLTLSLCLPTRPPDRPLVAAIRLSHASMAALTSERARGSRDRRFAVCLSTTTLNATGAEPQYVGGHSYSPDTAPTRARERSASPRNV